MKTLTGYLMAVLIAGISAYILAVPAYAQEVITGEQIAAADLKKGKRVFLRCQACHTLGEGERDKQGPNLWGLFSRKAGEHEGYKYSPAMEQADFEWTPDKMNEWLHNPRTFLPGNKMAFAGLPKEQDRINLIAFLIKETGYHMDGEEGHDEEDEDDQDHDQNHDHEEGADQEEGTADGDGE